MQHTYLRYECADSFAVTTSSSTTSTLTTSPLTFLSSSSNNKSKKTSSSSSIVLSTASSQIIGYNLRTNEPILKLGHRELLSGGLGTGKALNSNEVLCLTTSTSTTNNQEKSIFKVATGWKDGSIRIFEINDDDLYTQSFSKQRNNTTNKKQLDKIGLIHSIIHNNTTNEKNEEFIMREPLVLNGHNQSSIMCLSFDNHDDITNDGHLSAGRFLASGSSDGRIILWDVIAETGLFRLLGHKGPITDLNFVHLHRSTTTTTTSTTSKEQDTIMTTNTTNSTHGHMIGMEENVNDMVLISSSLDGLIKIWNMESQCCIQTIANHNGQVTCSSILSLTELQLQQEQQQKQKKNTDQKDTSNTTKEIISYRSRFMSGCIDGKVRVWSVHASKRMMGENERLNQSSKEDSDSTTLTNINKIDNDKIPNNIVQEDDVCTYMGTLPLPPNTISNEKIQCIQHHTYPAQHNIGNNINVDATITYCGILRTNTKHVDVYFVRNVNETMKKKIRRLRRRREKEQKKDSNNVGDDKKHRGKKRGLLDDDDDDENDDTGEKEMNDGKQLTKNELVVLDDDQIKASDEFEYLTTVRSSNKIKSFTFNPTKDKKGGIRIVLALASNALEVHSINMKQTEDVQKTTSIEYESNLVSTSDMYGHPTGIRSIALSSDDSLACTVSKNMAKVWNINNRSCLRSLPLSNKSTKSKKSSFYGLCVTFLPGDSHFVIGTKEGHLMIVDIPSGEIVYVEENAHEKEIWSIDLKKPSRDANNMMNNDDDGNDDSVITIMTGSADKSVKFWEIESQSDDDENEAEEMFNNHPMLVHVRTLQTSDDVVACRYSYDPTKRMVFVSTLDSQIKVFFDDTLKFFLSLYGHSLPALAIDASDDDTILASGGADKSIKIWGLDFGDTHRTLYGHSDSITDLRFVKKTHNFFTSSKDNTVRYWDADRFEQILLLNGHNSEINCLTVAKTGAFVLSGGMDRQVRVWERTKDMVFLEEEKERQMEEAFDKVDGREDRGTEEILRSGAQKDIDEDDMDVDDDNPQSEAAVKRSVLSVASGDRIMEALERADQELKDIAMFKSSQVGKNEKERKERTPNIMLMGMDPPRYILWVLRSIKSAELEQSLLILPLSHMERLMFYLISLLRRGEGVEICARASIFLVKTHKNQLVYGGSGSSGQKGSNMAVPLRELCRLLKLRLGEARDRIGYNIAAMKMVSRLSNERKNQYKIPDETNGPIDIWKGLGRL